MKRIISLSFLLAVFFQSYTQTPLDSLRQKFQKDSAHIYRFKKVRPWLALDQRNSWIKNEKGVKKIPVTINGAQAGIILKEKHKIGFGFYTVNNTSEKPKKLTDKNNTITYEELFLKYITIAYEYNILNTRYFALDVPLEVGLGRYVYNLKNESQIQLLWHEQGPVKVTGGGINIILKPLKWIGISGMGGYRVVVFNKRTNLNFNGFYYSYGVWVDLRQIYRDIKFYGFVRPKYRKKVKAFSAN